MNDELRVAETQYGLLTRRQLRNAGLSEHQIQRRITDQRIERVFPSVYRVVGSVRTWEQRALAACLWLGRNALISHTSAGGLLRLDPIRCDDLHATVPAGERRGRFGDVLLHASSIPKHERRIVNGVPCTSAARTLLDCAAYLDEEALESALDSARRLGLATVATVRRALVQGGRRPGVLALRRVLDVAEARPSESRLEVKLARLLRGSKLPPSVPQVVVGKYRIDRAWPAKRVGVEADGFQHHGRHLQWKRDRRRVAAIEAQGWRLVHVTWDDVTREPAQTLDRIAQAVTNLEG